MEDQNERRQRGRTDVKLTRKYTLRLSWINTPRENDWLVEGKIKETTRVLRRFKRWKWSKQHAGDTPQEAIVEVTTSLGEEIKEEVEEMEQETKEEEFEASVESLVFTGLKESVKDYQEAE